MRLRCSVLLIVQIIFTLFLNLSKASALSSNSEFIHSGGEKHCYCLTGEEPESQVNFFRAGCKIWLNSQKNCASKSIVSLSDFSIFKTKLPGSIKNGLLNVGYVGHWRDAYQSAMYFYLKATAFVFQYDTDLYFDNTACKGTDDLKYLAKSFNETYQAGRSEALPPGRKITYKGNQVVSVGVWDILLGKSINFWAAVEFSAAENTSRIVYPSCHDFLDKPCYGRFQNGQKASCMDSSSNIQSLICIKSDSESGSSSFWELIQ